MLSVADQPRQIGKRSNRLRHMLNVPGFSFVRSEDDVRDLYQALEELEAADLGIDLEDRDASGIRKSSQNTS